MTKSSKWMIITAVLAFASVISFFQVNSAWADAHDFNTWWKVIGIALGAGAVLSLRKVITNSN